MTEEIYWALAARASALIIPTLLVCALGYAWALLTEARFAGVAFAAGTALPAASVVAALNVQAGRNALAHADVTLVVRLAEAADPATAVRTTHLAVAERHAILDALVVDAGEPGRALATATTTAIIAALGNAAIWLATNRNALPCGGIAKAGIRAILENYLSTGVLIGLAARVGVGQFIAASCGTVGAFVFA